jgi:hypothetical protein|tara:strand:- start:5366 stop:5962 length:597 start_codon:yes stop_codon:yes gene_type:complete
MDKDKADKIKQKVNYSKNESEINFVKEQGKSIGLAVDNMKPMELNEPVFDGEPLLAKKNGKYRIDEKHFALMFLEAFQNEDKITGELVPLYSRVEQMVGIPASTLRGWWARREDIMSQRATTLQQGLNYISTAMMVEMMRMTQAMANIDYAEMVSNKPQDMHNFISLFNTLINKFRLMNNQSTTNVQHQHEVELVIPD